MTQGWIVIIKVGYYDYAFKFDTIEEAGKFSETMLLHYFKRDKEDKELYVTIKPIVSEQQNKDEEEDE